MVIWWFTSYPCAYINIYIYIHWNIFNTCRVLPSLLAICWNDPPWDTDTPWEVVRKDHWTGKWSNPFFHLWTAEILCIKFNRLELGTPLTTFAPHCVSPVPPLVTPFGWIDQWSVASHLACRKVRQLKTPWLIIIFSIKMSINKLGAHQFWTKPYNTLDDMPWISLNYPLYPCIMVDLSPVLLPKSPALGVGFAPQHRATTELDKWWCCRRSWQNLPKACRSCHRFLGGNESLFCGIWRFPKMWVTPKWMIVNSL